MSDYYSEPNRKGDVDRLPLFDKTRQVPEFTEEDRKRRDNRTVSLKNVLIGGQWYSTSVLAKRVGHRFSTNIQDLRDSGHVIEKRRCANGEFEYRLVGRRRVKRVPESWHHRYLRSSHWQAKRAARIEYDGGKCCDCGTSFNVTVHHWRYDLFHERLEDLMTLCEACHRKIHDYDRVHITFPRYLTEELWNRLRDEPCPE